jgi:hypothetical protein
MFKDVACFISSLIWKFMVIYIADLHYINSQKSPLMLVF